VAASAALLASCNNSALGPDTSPPQESAASSSAASVTLPPSAAPDATLWLDGRQIAALHRAALSKPIRLTALLPQGTRDPKGWALLQVKSADGQRLLQLRDPGHRHGHLTASIYATSTHLNFALRRPGGAIDMLQRKIARIDVFTSLPAGQARTVRQLVLPGRAPTSLELKLLAGIEQFPLRPDRPQKKSWVLRDVIDKLVGDTDYEKVVLVSAKKRHAVKRAMLLSPTLTLRLKLNNKGDLRFDVYRQEAGKLTRTARLSDVIKIIIH
jgi:hypothetical protein